MISEETEEKLQIAWRRQIPIEYAYGSGFGAIIAKVPKTTEDAEQWLAAIRAKQHLTKDQLTPMPSRRVSDLDPLKEAQRRYWLKRKRQRQEASQV